MLFPPLTTVQATALVQQLEDEIGAGIAIVDLNDFGGSIRATSPRSLPAAELLHAMGGNPLGQRATGTPFVVVRRTEDPPAT